MATIRAEVERWQTFIKRTGIKAGIALKGPPIKPFYNFHERDQNLHHGFSGSRLCGVGIGGCGVWLMPPTG